MAPSHLSSPHGLNYVPLETSSRCWREPACLVLEHKPDTLFECVFDADSLRAGVLSNEFEVPSLVEKILLSGKARVIVPQHTLTALQDQKKHRKPTKPIGASGATNATDETDAKDANNSEAALALAALDRLTDIYPSRAIVETPGASYKTWKEIEEAPVPPVHWSPSHERYSNSNIPVLGSSGELHNALGISHTLGDSSPDNMSNLRHKSLPNMPNREATTIKVQPPIGTGRPITRGTCAAGSLALASPKNLGPSVPSYEQVEIGVRSFFRHIWWAMNTQEKQGIQHFWVIISKNHLIIRGASALGLPVSDLSGLVQIITKTDADFHSRQPPLLDGGNGVALPHGLDHPTVSDVEVFEPGEGSVSGFMAVHDDVHAFKHASPPREPRKDRERRRQDTLTPKTIDPNSFNRYAASKIRSNSVVVKNRQSHLKRDIPIHGPAGQRKVSNASISPRSSYEKKPSNFRDALHSSLPRINANVNRSHRRDEKIQTQLDEVITHSDDFNHDLSSANLDANNTTGNRHQTGGNAIKYVSSHPRLLTKLVVEQEARLKEARTPRHGGFYRHPAARQKEAQYNTDVKEDICLADSAIALPKTEFNQPMDPNSFDRGSSGRSRGRRHGNHLKLFNPANS